MNTVNHIQELSIAYKKTFANLTQTEWGYLFYNKENPTHYDANHAHIYEEPNEFISVHKEVVDFFRSIQVPARYYFYNVKGSEKFIVFLKNQGWQYETSQKAVQLWTGEMKNIEQNHSITIELVNDKNYQEALEVECAISEFGGKEVREKAFEFEYNSSSFEHYLLRYEGSPVATACLFINKDHLQLESVATIKEYRGKGLINYLINHIQSVAMTKDFKYLWVFPINEQVEKIYTRNGFETVDYFHFGHAFLEGRAIKDIHKGD